MTSAPDDNFRNIGEIIRKMLEQAGMSEHPAPVIFNFRIYVNMPAGPVMQQSPGYGKNDTIEPEVEVQRVGNEVILVTEMPGVSPEDVKVMFSGSTVHIKAADGDLKYHTTADVPPAEKDTVSVSFRHGVLEVTYREQFQEPGPSGDDEFPHY
jgi:HSP20 family molecular chaperone IbpA